MSQIEDQNKIAMAQRHFAKVWGAVVNCEVPDGGDGLVQVVPFGRFAIEWNGQRIIQVVDRTAAELMAKNSGKVLLDYEHGSWAQAGSTEAAGWIGDWEVREDGLYGRIEWSDTGLAAVNGKRFRFLSPTFLVSEMQQLGGMLRRPTRVVDAGLTNRPNMRSIRPLTNQEFSQTKEDDMHEKVMALLGLEGDASEGAIEAAVLNASALIEKGRKLDAALEEVEALKNAAKKNAVDAVLNSHAGLLTADNRGHYEAVCNHDLELGRKLLADLAAVRSTPRASVLTNRQPMGTPQGDVAGLPKQQQIDALVNARKAAGVSFEVAFHAVRAERPDLFA
jgi:phage I-like protein